MSGAARGSQHANLPAADQGKTGIDQVGGGSGKFQQPVEKTFRLYTAGEQTLIFGFWRSQKPDIGWGQVS